MRNLLPICLILLLLSCSKDRFFYQGYIYKNDLEPAVDFIVKGDLQPSDIDIRTDSNGYFIIKNPDWVNMFIYIYDKGQLIDSIQTLRSSGGERLNYYFTNDRSDTIFLDSGYQ